MAYSNIVFFTFDVLVSGECCESVARDYIVVSNFAQCLCHVCGGYYHTVLLAGAINVIREGNTAIRPR